MIELFIDDEKEGNIPFSININGFPVFATSVVFEDIDDIINDLCNELIYVQRRKRQLRND